MWTGASGDTSGMPHSHPHIKTNKQLDREIDRTGTQTYTDKQGNQRRESKDDGSWIHADNAW